MNSIMAFVSVSKQKEKNLPCEKTTLSTLKSQPNNLSKGIFQQPTNIPKNHIRFQKLFIPNLMGPIRRDNPPLQRHNRQQEIIAQRRISLFPQERHEKPKPNKYHHVNVLIHNVQIQLAKVTGLSARISEPKRVNNEQRELNPHETPRR